MNLNFILSLGFEQINFEDFPRKNIGRIQCAKKFNVSNGNCTSGIFQHKTKKDLFFLIYQDNGDLFAFTGHLKIDGFSQLINLSIGIAGHDSKMEKKIIRMVVKEYTK
jgi:hypothetical protein